MSKEVATTETKAVAVPTEKPAGFDGLGAEEFAPPVIKLWAKMTKAVVEGGELGQFYDVNTAKVIGKSFTFQLLALKNVKYEKEDKKTGEVKIQNVKNLLIRVNGSLLPKVLTLSVTSFAGLRKVLTAAYEASVMNAGMPLYAFDITATAEVTSNENGDYAIAAFTLGDKVSSKDYEYLTGLYEQFGKSFAVVDTEKEFA